MKNLKGVYLFMGDNINSLMIKKTFYHHIFAHGLQIKAIAFVMD